MVTGGRNTQEKFDEFCDTISFLQIKRHHKYSKKENYQPFKVFATIVDRKIRKTMAKMGNWHKEVT